MRVAPDLAACAGAVRGIEAELLTAYEEWLRAHHG